MIINGDDNPNTIPGTADNDTIKQLWTAAQRPVASRAELLERASDRLSARSALLQTARTPDPSRVRNPHPPPLLSPGNASKAPPALLRGPSAFRKDGVTLASSPLHTPPPAPI